MNIFYLIIALSALVTIAGMLKDSFVFKKNKEIADPDKQVTVHKTGDLQWDEYHNPQIFGE